MKLNEQTTWLSEKHEDGVIYNVKVLGATSTNKRSYPMATRQKAVKVLEGAKVNLDHQGKTVPVSARFGKLKNVRDTAHGTFADLHYLKGHPMASAIVEAAQTMPEVLGLSLLGEGTGDKKDAEGNLIIESIDKVFSVDVVANPATCRGLYEAEEEEDTKSAEDHVWEGVKNAVVACLDEDMEMSEKMAKIKELLKAFEKMYGKKEADKADETDGDMEEEKKQTFNATLLISEAKLEPDEHLVELIQSLPEEKAKQHLAWMRRKAVVRTVKAAVPVAEAAVLEKDYVKLLRGGY